MSDQTIYTKTAKGVLEIRNRTVRLPRDLERVFTLVDGKSTVAEMLSKDDGISSEEIGLALEKLATEGLIKIFSTDAAPNPPAQNAAFNPNEAMRTRAYAAPRAAEVPQTRSDLADLDFTSPESLCKLNQVAEARARA